MLLGQVLREQAGESLFAEVEELRQIAIRRREEQSGSAPASEEAFVAALGSVPSLDLVQTYRLARAFAFYFELINLAETNHRKRRRLSLQLSGEAQRGSLRGTLRAMRAAGISSEEALDWLCRIRIIPVFTAHPTEVARRVVMFKRRRIADLLEQLDRIPLSDEQLESFEDGLTAEITALWETDEVRTRRPTVADEVKMGLDYYDASLYATLPGLYAEVAAAFEAEYGCVPSAGRDAAAALVRILDWRRPRWQPVCHAAGDARGHANGPRPFDDALSTAIAAGARSADQLGAAGADQRRT